MKYNAPARMSVTTAATGSANSGVWRAGRAAHTRAQSSGGASVGAKWCESSKSSHSDMAASVSLHYGSQALLQTLVRAVQPGCDGSQGATQHFGDLFVGQTLRI